MKDGISEFRGGSDPAAQTELFSVEPGAKKTSPMKLLVTELRVAVLATLSVSVVVCGIYPLMVWAVSQGLFPYEANGSLIQRGGRTVGSELIAQSFTCPKYFHPRPSAAGEAGYDAGSSSGSNLGPLSKKLLEAVKQRVEAYRAENDLPSDILVPADAVTASSSGLDPHISLQNARLQARRVTQARAISLDEVEKTIQAHAEGRGLGIFGEPTINVLKLNLALDGKR
jgi:potassium-transporting ATPase KdpC subunit